MSMVNVVTILQRAGRNRLRLNSEVVRYLAEVCKELRGTENGLSPRAVGCALYGLQRLGDTPEVRSLVAALTERILESQGNLDAQGLGRVASGAHNL